MKSSGIFPSLGKAIGVAGWLWSRGLLLILLAMGFAPSFATDPVRYDVRSWQTDEGLPVNTVQSIAQTPDGFLWVGTKEGLSRFDGVSFRLFEEMAVPRFKQASVQALLAAREGGLWIGIEGGGLAHWSDGRLSWYSKSDGLPGLSVRCLAEARDGSLWIGTDSGLARMKSGVIKVFNPKPGVTDAAVNSFCVDALNILRVATPNGMWSLDADEHFSEENFSVGAIRFGLRTVYSDRSTNLWFGGSGGLRYVKLSEERPVIRTTKLLQQIVSAVIEDESSQHWVGTVRGVVRMRGDEVIGWPLNAAFTGDLVNTIFQDREGSIWLGCRDGLYRLTPARFTHITAQQGLTANDVMSVCQDASGSIWAASFVSGLSKITGSNIKWIRSTNGLSDDAVLSLHPSRDGGMWVGMDYGRGLNKLNRAGQNILVAQTDLVAAPIRVIHESESGAVWIGTGKGLNVIRDGETKTYTITNGLAGDNITAICEDRQKNIWVGTIGGVSRWSGLAFSNFTERQGLPNNFVSLIYEDRDGDIWVGTKGGGLSRLKSGKFTSYSSKQGLFSDEVFEVVSDDADYFWMSCKRGLFRVKRSQFDDLDAGKIPLLNCTVFGREDGLPTVQFNGVAKPSAFKSRDGRIWFATIRGVVAVEPQMKVNERPPLVSIEEVVADRQKLSRTVTGKTNAELTIPPGGGGLEIHYTALSLQTPEKNKFRYRLEGVDADWVEAERRRVAYYNNVAPGSYRFHVIACNNDGVWNETGATLDLIFAPHYWQTGWFRVVMIAAPFLILAVIYRARMARLKALADLRIRIAQDLHDDVGSRLTRVAMVTELADRETPAGGAGKPHIQNITRTVRDITRAMDEIVWTINPRNDSLENLANYIFHYAQEYFQDTGVRCRLDLSPDLPDRRVTTEERHHLFMAVKEALNNVLKHARASEVRISLVNFEKRMMIVIVDNGRGVNDGLSDPTGDGLLNMKQRLASIGGKFDIESKSGVGTTVTMRLPGRWSA